MLADGKSIPRASGLSPIAADPAYCTDVLALVPLELHEHATQAAATSATATTPTTAITTEASTRNANF
jgi:hypothetical protein